MGQAWNVDEHDEDEPASASAPELPVNEQAWRILSELERDGQSPREHKLTPGDWVIGTILAIVTLPLFYWLRSVAFDFPGAWMVILAILPGIVVSMFIRAQSGMLREGYNGGAISGLLGMAFSKAMPDREGTVQAQYQASAAYDLRESGLVERVLLGLDQLPDIFAAVRFPWQFFLGSRPRTLLASLKLLARNLDWYMYPEEPYVNPSWKLRLAALIVLPLAILLLVFFHLQPWGPGLALDPTLSLVFYFLIPVVVFTGLSILTEYALQDIVRQRSVFKALAQLLRQRLNGEGEESAQPVDPGW